MTTEWGALTGLFPIDSVLAGWLPYKSTEAALYNIAGLTQASTHTRFTYPRVDELLGNQLSADKGAKAYLVSCTNSRASDLAAAAKVFEDAAGKNGGKIPKIAEGVNFYIAAASTPEQLAAEEAGDWQAMLDAGAQPLPAGCGLCIGLGTGLLEPGEVGISASNRNSKGRMGSTDAKAYLASPEVVAANALSGRINGPGWYERPEGWSDDLVGTAEKDIHGGETAPKEDDGTLTEVLPGFPEKVEGEIVFCDADNINTDGIYPGKYTYQDDTTVEKMAQVCVENYDTDFTSIAKEGNILVSGFNFGCGSSREQAATAILAKKTPLVVAGSFGNIFSRNSINNALMGVEVPRLVHTLRKTFSGVPAEVSQKDVKEPKGNCESIDSPPPAPQNTPSQEKKLTRRTG
ncbi:MAG: mitochondrial [Lasallia pustulata]|uniref:Mitochondrial n=1 Tax=Lasallia pustulata TaxID=136370 RepID=A0A5M8PXJ1_9LECA|nr:MAG: mitochondrial [Lasallia pustulata]